MDYTLTEADRRELQRRGITETQAEQQIKILSHDPSHVSLDRPCTLGDGIQSLEASELESLAQRHDQAAQAGRWLKFVPASGAASRMFALGEEADLARLCEQLPEFAFYSDLRDACRRAGEDLAQLRAQRSHAEVLRLLREDVGLGYANLPKGLLKFHRYVGHSRTPLEEHLYEAAHCFQAADGLCQVHLTITPQHQELFQALLEQVAPQLERRRARLDVTFSTQKRSTNTLALTQAGRPLRDEQGKLVLRPGGHGALLENLNDLQADLVFIKNIDNIAHESRQGLSRLWIRVLGGYLVSLQQQVHQHLETLEAAPDGTELREIVRFAQTHFAVELPEQAPPAQTRQQLLQLLNRPLRVCGMVRNQGEPGGGPFWALDASGAATLQIVESAEMDSASPQQDAIASRATHFNPVFMALGLRDHRGRPFELPDYVNQDRCIVTRKTSLGQTVRVLEKPGLWNGSMANWITVFVETPIEVFSPVKTVLDLLRMEHQPVN